MAITAKIIEVAAGIITINCEEINVLYSRGRAYKAASIAMKERIATSRITIATMNLDANFLGIPLSFLFSMVDDRLSSLS